MYQIVNVKIDGAEYAESINESLNQMGPSCHYSNRIGNMKTRSMTTYIIFSRKGSSW